MALKIKIFHIIQTWREKKSQQKKKKTEVQYWLLKGKERLVMEREAQTRGNTMQCPKIK